MTVKINGPDGNLVMIRDEGFYVICTVQGKPLEDQARDNAVLNPGTVRVEDVHGNVLWVAPSEKN